MKRTGRMEVVVARALGLGLVLGLWACGADGEHGNDHEHGDGGHEHENEDADHAHGDEVGGHEHGEEVSLGTVGIGEHSVELAQGLGGVEAGKECQLVVKLPWSDGGQTVVRAWIGGEDRTLSFVGKGVYAPSHDDYDIVVTAPEALGAGALWRFEIAKPDGTKLLGSVAPSRGE